MECDKNQGTFISSVDSGNIDTTTPLVKCIAADHVSCSRIYYLSRENKFWGAMEQHHYCFGLGHDIQNLRKILHYYYNVYAGYNLADSTE